MICMRCGLDQSADGACPEDQQPRDRQRGVCARQRNQSRRRGVDPQRMAQIRRGIAAGTYLTESKIDAVVDRLLEELRRGGGGSLQRRAAS